MATECRTVRRLHSLAVGEENAAELSSSRYRELGNGRVREGCRVLKVEMEVKASPSQQSREGESLASEAAVPGGNGANLSFSKELIRFSLQGKVPAKLKHQQKESLNSKLAEVEQAFKNIPRTLYFSPSSVAYDGIGVCAAEPLLKDTILGPYLGETVRKEQVEAGKNNRWLWEVYEGASLSYFIDARDPKYGNWMNFIQCARSSLEQNLRVAQYNNYLYFVATTDIQVGEELLVWYDQEQYNTYMGLPTGFRDVPPPPMFLQQQAAPQDATGHTSPGIPPLPLQDHLAPPTYSSYSSSYLDSASPDDSGLSMGPTPPLPMTYDPTRSGHPNPHKDGSTCNLLTEGDAYISDSDFSQLLADLMPGDTSFPTSEGYSYSDVEDAEHLQQWYNITSVCTNTLNTSADGDKLATSNTSDTPPEASSSWVGHMAPESFASWVGGPTGSFVESPTGPTTKGTVRGGGGGGEGKKQQLLYGLFSHSKDGSKEGSKDGSKEGSKDGSKEGSKDGSKEGSKDGSKEGSKESSKEGSKEGSKDSSKEGSKEGSKDSSKDCSKDGSKWRCKECKKLLSSHRSLRVHARIHTGERPYQCQYCYKAFCQVSTLRSHKRLHTGEKPYKCKDCGRAFTQSAGLRSHRRNINPCNPHGHCDS